MSLTEQQRHPSEEPSDLSPSPAGPTSSTKSKGGGSSPTLGDMLAAGLLQAGQDNVTVIYRGVTYSASLQANGTIAFRGACGNTDEIDCHHHRQHLQLLKFPFCFCRVFGLTLTASAVALTATPAADLFGLLSASYIAGW